MESFNKNEKTALIHTYRLLAPTISDLNAEAKSIKTDFDILKSEINKAYEYIYSLTKSEKNKIWSSIYSSFLDRVEKIKGRIEISDKIFDSIIEKLNNIKNNLDKNFTEELSNLISKKFKEAV